MQLHMGGLITEPAAGAISSHSTPTLSGSILIPEPREHVEVPESSFQPCPQLLSAIQVVDPLATCTDFGKSFYLHIVQIVGTHLSSGCGNCQT